MKGWRGFVLALPLVFIAASLVLVFQYNEVLNATVGTIQSRVQEQSPSTLPRPNRDINDILAKTDLNDIPYSSGLMILYIAIFLTAEAAFIMMAIKEYLQDLVGLSEMDLIRGYRITASQDGVAPVDKFMPSDSVPSSEHAEAPMDLTGRRIALLEESTAANAITMKETQT